MKKYFAPAIKIAQVELADIIATSDLRIYGTSTNSYLSRGNGDFDDDDWD